MDTIAHEAGQNRADGNSADPGPPEPPTETRVRKTIFVEIAAYPYWPKVQLDFRAQRCAGTVRCPRVPADRHAVPAAGDPDAAWSYWVFRGKVRADVGYH